MSEKMFMESTKWSNPEHGAFGCEAFKAGWRARDGEIEELQAKLNFAHSECQGWSEKCNELRSQCRRLDTCSASLIDLLVKERNALNSNHTKSKRLVEALIEIRDERKAFGASCARAARAISEYEGL